MPTPSPCAPVADEAGLIIGEALRNAARHAKATTIAVTIDFARDRVDISVRDDGVGIPRDILANGRQKHFGLQGMHERARLIGASLSIEGVDGKGTQVRLSLPARIAFR